MTINWGLLGMGSTKDYYQSPEFLEDYIEECKLRFYRRAYTYMMDTPRERNKMKGWGAGAKIPWRQRWRGGGEPTLENVIGAYYVTQKGYERRHYYMGGIWNHRYLACRHKGYRSMMKMMGGKNQFGIPYEIMGDLSKEVMIQIAQGIIKNPRYKFPTTDASGRYAFTGGHPYGGGQKMMNLDETSALILKSYLCQQLYATKKSHLMSWFTAALEH